MGKSYLTLNGIDAIARNDFEGYTSTGFSLNTSSID